jgi:hypothetical protein
MWATVPINVNPQRGGRAYVGYLISNCIPTLGILISILARSWGNLNRMTFINIDSIYCNLLQNGGAFDQYLLPDGGAFD